MDEIIIVILTTILITVLTSIFLIPIVFVINSKLEFDHYLKLLWAEIEENQERVNAYQSHFEEVRSGKRNWMPKGQPYQISSDCALVENSDLSREITRMECNNSETDGIKYRYLPDNIYSNLINQKYFLFIHEGHRNSLARLYYFYKCLSYLVQIKENRLLTDYGMENRKNHYTQEEFSMIYERYLPLINKEFKDLTTSKNTLKQPFWWLPFIDLKKNNDEDSKKTLEQTISVNIFILTLGLFIFGTIQIYFSYLQLIAIQNQGINLIPLANQMVSISFVFAFAIVLLLLYPIIRKSLK
jgi:hypothetical protein